MASILPARVDRPEQTVSITLSGHVQGVGFRPFVYRIAMQHGLLGEVQNRVGEVRIVATGSAAAIDGFQQDLIDRAPPLSRPVIDSVEQVTARPFRSFSIAASSESADAKIFVPPDYFMCDECRDELNDPADRRYRYPFINCTQCGPRYTLIRQLPYDRCNTSMESFPLCAACSEEYTDPADRRFHAEPVACPDCGPQLNFRTGTGGDVIVGDAALAATLDCLRNGQIIAVKGVGGYHLMCDAANADAVTRLRQRKHRPDKPLAVMFPVQGNDGLAAVRRAVFLTEEIGELVRSPIRPIVLADKTDTTGLADNVAPGLGELGVFLPYAPLHQLLLGDFGAPLVATSGNISGEPVLTDNVEVDKRLSHVADAFLHHDRPILRPADDPVYRRVAGGARPLRLGRGVAPREMTLPWQLRQPVLAVGGHMKGTVALAWDERVVVSPHIGEMDSPRSLAVFETVVADLQALYGVEAKQILCDAHPGYATHRWANAQSSLPVKTIWHHRAHASALAAEHAGDSRWLIFTWDGVGLGEDGTMWGGEALLGRPGDWQRAGSMRPFRLPGGERAGREPWRSAAALHWECERDWARRPAMTDLAYSAWRRQLNSPRTSAVGRLFDAASAMICDLHEVSFEAQGPMAIEALCEGSGETIDLPLSPGDDAVVRTDWEPLLEMLADERRTRPARAEAFHSSMAAALVGQVRHVCRSQSFDYVGLAGGVFQNRVLTDQVVSLLEEDGLSVYLGERLPCNDAALAFGQVAEFVANIAPEKN